MRMIMTKITVNKTVKVPRQFSADLGNYIQEADVVADKEGVGNRFHPEYVEYIVKTQSEKKSTFKKVVGTAIYTLDVFTITKEEEKVAEKQVKEIPVKEKPVVVVEEPVAVEDPTEQEEKPARRGRPKKEEGE